MLWFVHRASENLWFNALHVFEDWPNTTKMHHLRTDFVSVPASSPWLVAQFAQQRSQDLPRPLPGMTTPIFPSGIGPWDWPKSPIFACQCSHRCPPNCSLMSFKCFSQSLIDSGKPKWMLRVEPQKKSLRSSKNMFTRITCFSWPNIGPQQKVLEAPSWNHCSTTMNSPIYFKRSHGHVSHQ